MKQNNSTEQTETVTVQRECTRCEGTCRTCDVCDWNVQHNIVEPCHQGSHERDTACHCIGGQVDVDIEVPVSVVKEWESKQ